MGSPVARLHLTLSDLERSSSRPLRYLVVGHLYAINIFASNNITALNWMSQKGVCWRARISAVPVVFLVFNLCSLIWHFCSTSDTH